MKFLAAIWLLLLIQFGSNAQFNDSIHNHVAITATGNINKVNNSTSYIFNHGIRYSTKKKWLELNTAASWIYGENGSVRTNNDYLAGGDLNFLKDIRKVYYWALVSYEKSFSLKIVDRFQSGVGVGYTAFDKKNLKVVLTDGPLYEVSNLAQPDKYGRIRYETIRNSFRLKYYVAIRDMVFIEGSNFIQNSLSDKNDYNIKTVNSLSLRIYKSLRLATTLTYNRFNLTESENLLLNYGLTWENWF